MEKTRETLKVRDEVALLVNVALPDNVASAGDSLDELESLAASAGAVVAGRIYQKRRRPHPKLYVGTGKAVEIAEAAERVGADTVVFDNDLSPAQIRELEKVVNRKVLDRSELILDIFADRARTHEARLQVELAQLQYTYPRLTRLWSHLDTMAGGASSAAAAVGGIGTRGPGEKQLEIDRRLVKKRLSMLQRQIGEIDRRKERQVGARRGFFQVCLVGYTNAGKSTLMNALAGADAYVEDKLFATLDTKTARWNLGQELSVLLSDTVGFVRDLPHHLVASFRATLEEAIHADLLLHVVDVSNPQAEMQFEAARRVLEEIGCAGKDVVLVLNKVDRQGAGMMADTMKTLYPEAVKVSAKKGVGIEELSARVRDYMTGEIVRVRVRYAAGDGRIGHFLRAYGQVVQEHFEDSTAVVEAQVGRNQLHGLGQFREVEVEVL